MERKPIQVSDDTWAILGKEARLQSAEKNIPISMGDVVSQFARRLLTKHKKADCVNVMEGSEYQNDH